MLPLTVPNAQCMAENRPCPETRYGSTEKCYMHNSLKESLKNLRENKVAEVHRRANALPLWLMTQNIWGQGYLLNWKLPREWQRIDIFKDTDMCFGQHPPCHRGVCYTGDGMAALKTTHMDLVVHASETLKHQRSQGRGSGKCFLWIRLRWVKYRPETCPWSGALTCPTAA